MSPQRTLLLAPPSLAHKESKLRDVFHTYDRQTTDLQMLDRLVAGLVTLPADTYDSILVLVDMDGNVPLTRDVYSAIVPTMKAGAKLQRQGETAFDAVEAQEAVLAGLIEKDGSFEKLGEESSGVVPLRLGARRKLGLNGNGRITKQKKEDEDDELIDEDTLLTEEDMKRGPIQQPPECQPKPGRKRRACKDCTCGLAAQLEAEDKARRNDANSKLNILKLQADDLFEEDFTVKGKVGSCGSCALGDAFRCAGCPYIGLPAFKPGEEVRILNDIDQF